MVKCDNIFVLINKITHIMPQSRIYTTDIPYTPCIRGNRSFDRMIVWFIFTYTISAISIPIWGLPIVLDITLRNNHLILGGGSNGFLFCFFTSFYIFRIWKKWSGTENMYDIICQWLAVCRWLIDLDNPVSIFKLTKLDVAIHLAPKYYWN